MYSPTYASTEELISKFPVISDSLADPVNPTDDELDRLESILVMGEQYVDSYIGCGDSIGDSCEQPTIFPRTSDCCCTENKGSFDASSGNLPTNFKFGYYWKVSVAGTVGSLGLSVGDYLIANTMRGNRSSAKHFDVFTGECPPRQYCFIPWQIKDACLFISFYLFEQEKSIVNGEVVSTLDDDGCGGSFSIGSLSIDDGSSSSSSSSDSNSNCADDFLCTDIGSLFSNLLKGFRCLSSSF